MELHYKEPGITMNQFIINVSKKINNKKIAYTARLDPMARGMVPILIGDECKKINSHLKTNKTYKVKVIKGIQTDSDDPLGIIQKIEDNKTIDLTNFIIDKPITFNQQYHYFSTKELNHRRQKLLNNKEILQNNSHEITIFSCKVLSNSKINFTDFKNKIINQINNIDKNKNFRQEEIINQWNKLNLDCLEYIELELNVSSGFFVRQFIRDISNKLNYPLMCFDIHRTEIEKIHE